MSINNIRESYIDRSALYCANSGIITIENDVISEGKLLHFGSNQPFGFDQSILLGKAITITSSDDCNTFGNPVNQDGNGDFSVDVRNGKFIRIERDIDDAI